MHFNRHLEIVQTSQNDDANPISIRMRVHNVLSELVWPVSDVSGIRLAYMRYGVVRWPPSWRACVSVGDSTQGGIWLGAVVHSAS